MRRKYSCFSFALSLVLCENEKNIVKWRKIFYCDFEAPWFSMCAPNCMEHNAKSRAFSIPQFAYSAHFPLSLSKLIVFKLIWFRFFSSFSLSAFVAESQHEFLIKIVYNHDSRSTAKLLYSNFEIFHPPISMRTESISVSLCLHSISNRPHIEH